MCASEAAWANCTVHQDHRMRKTRPRAKCYGCLHKGSALLDREPGACLVAQFPLLLIQLSTPTGARRISLSLDRLVLPHPGDLMGSSRCVSPLFRECCHPMSQGSASSRGGRGAEGLGEHAVLLAGKAGAGGLRGAAQRAASCIPRARIYGHAFLALLDGVQHLCTGTSSH